MASDNQKNDKELSEKEELIAALTAQLEQAAEQLDRYQRTGSERKHESSSAPKTSGESKTVLMKVDQFVDDWNALEAPFAFNRIESQLQQIQDLLENSTSVQASFTEEPSSESAPEDTANDAWAQMKNALLSGEEVAPSAFTSELPSEEGGVGDTNVGDTDTNLQTRVVPEEQPLEHVSLNLPDAPEDLDVEMTDPELLWEAIIERDDYISTLLHSLQKLQSRATATVPNDWASLSDCPEELRTRVEYLEAQLTERLRFAEVEESVQRAQLARKETRLKLFEEQIAKKIKKANLDSALLEEIENISATPLLQEDDSIEEKNVTEESKSQDSLLMKFLRSK